MSSSTPTQQQISTHFFPFPLTRLLIIVANETDPDHAAPLSPHDISDKSELLHTTASQITHLRTSSDTLSTSKIHTVPICADSKSPEYKRLTKYVTDFLNMSPASPLSSPHIQSPQSTGSGSESAVTLVNDSVAFPVSGIIPSESSQTNHANGVLVCASARHYRFYEKWSFQFFSHQVHVINTGQTTVESKETFLRSVQRALRVVSPELHLHQSSLNVIWSIHVDAVCHSSSSSSSSATAETTLIAYHPSKQEQEYISTGSQDEKIFEGRSVNDNEGNVVLFSVFGADLSEKLVRNATNPKPWSDEIPKDFTSSIVSALTIKTTLSLRTHVDPIASALSSTSTISSSSIKMITGRSYARVGLMGNPSDQFHGKSLSVTIKNFWATVCLIPNVIREAEEEGCDSSSAIIHFTPHPVSDDTMNFANIGSVRNQVRVNGYTGGIRLLQATVKRFVEHTLDIIEKNKNIVDDDARSLLFSAQKVLDKMRTQGFTLQYDTNVPRQVGLAGSSCIISAALKALLQFYQVDTCSHFMPVNNRPTFVLEVETKEHGINAGLMDRVAQMFEGCMEMDFTNPELTHRNGHAIYTRHAISSLPQLHLAVALDPSDSGKLHATVAKRFKDGDQEVLDAVKNWISLVDGAVEAMKEIVEDESSTKKNHAKFRWLMDQNFDLRRKVYGDQCLGWKNLKMVEIARKHNASTKFPGSGGAVLVATDPEHTDVDALAADLETHGFSLVKIEPFEP